jgi:hypothetical protein
VNNVKEQILAEHREKLASIRKIPSVWKRFRAEEKLRAETIARIRAIENVETEVRIERTLRVAESLKCDSAMISVVRKYNGHSQYGWEKACGCDGRIKRVTRSLGWNLTSQVIWEIRRERNIWPAR